jgi:hypothetical protein
VVERGGGSCVPVPDHDQIELEIRVELGFEGHTPFPYRRD